MQLRDILHDRSLLEQVIALGDQNSKHLGHFPEQAFRREAAAGNLFAAIDAANRVVGYVLYRVARGRAVVQHLCVKADCRRSGVGRLLIDELKRRTRHLPYICCHVAKEFEEAVQAWKRFGFVYSGEKPGRGFNQRPLFRMVFDHGHQTLWSDVERERAESTLVVALDMNVALALRAASDYDTEIGALQSDWLREEVSYWVTKECFAEAARSNDTAERRSTVVHLQRFGQLDRNESLEQSVFDQLCELVGRGSRVQDASDLRQVAQSIAAGADVFLTRDDRVLRHSELLRQFQISVLRPSDLIVKLDEFARGEDYAPTRLHGSGLQFQRVTHDVVDSMISAFLNHREGEKKHSLDARIRGTLALVREGEVRTVRDGTGEVQALVALCWSNESVGEIPVLRVRRGRMASVLTRHLLAYAVRRFSENGRRLVRVTDGCTSIDVRAEAVHLGFMITGKSIAKFSASGLVTREQVSAQFVKFHGNEPAIGSADQPVVSLHPTDRCVANDARIERQIWPGILADSTLPSFVVPIQPKFARHLFDGRLNDGHLFGGDSSLLLNCENVYFRSAHVPVVRAPGHVLWYVTKDTTDKVRQLRGMSMVLDVQVGPAQRLFRQYEKLGVYQWRDVNELTGGEPEKPILAIHFGPTEMFSHPIAGADLRGVISSHSGNGDPPLSMPVELRHDCFCDLIERSYGR